MKCGKICRVKTGTKVSLYCHEDKMDSNGHCGFMFFGGLTHSRFANIILTMLKGQDIVVLAVLMEKGLEAASYSRLAKSACLSVSETYGAIKRLRVAGLLSESHGLLRRNVREFLKCGLRYVFPLRPSGGIARGRPTSYAAPVAASEFAASGLPPVWEGSVGNVLGQTFEPLYPTVPDAAAADAALYDRLALMDMLRGGRIRERQFANEKMEAMLT